MADRPIAARVGLLGVPASGKTAVFAALTGTDYARARASTGKAVAANVRVLDPRLVRIHEVEGSQKKIVTPILELVDPPSVFLEGPGQEENAGRLAAIRECDGYLAVLRAYEGDDPLRQLEALRNALVRADLDVIRKRIGKLEGDTHRSTQNREESIREAAVLRGLAEAVAGGDAGAFEKLTVEDERRLRGFRFYSRKPVLPLANVAETRLGRDPGVPAAAIRLETELLAMEPSERAGFMQDYGLSRLVLETLPREIYGRLGLLTFVTVSERDVSGWHLRAGGTAYEAAGRIHTDLQKGFIGCEVVAFAEWEKWRNYHEAHARGHTRVVGREYAVQDFDFLHVKFNV